VDDAEEQCPVCGATDWDEYTPFEEWRGGRGSKVDGTHVASPVVSCRVGGHEEREGGIMRFSSPEDEAHVERDETFVFPETPTAEQLTTIAAGLMAAPAASSI
jgi:hypothetical protein